MDSRTNEEIRIAAMLMAVANDMIENIIEREADNADEDIEAILYSVNDNITDTICELSKLVKGSGVKKKSIDLILKMGEKFGS